MANWVRAWQQLLSGFPSPQYCGYGWLSTEFREKYSVLNLGWMLLTPFYMSRSSHTLHALRVSKEEVAVVEMRCWCTGYMARMKLCSCAFGVAQPVSCLALKVTLLRVSKVELGGSQITANGQHPLTSWQAQAPNEYGITSADSKP